MASNKFLSKETELELGKKVQLMLKIKDELKEKKKTMTVEEISEAEKVIQEGKEAVEILVHNHEMLVQRIATKYKSKYPSAPDIEDLVQDGKVGLLNAIYRYDPKRGNKLSTVASPWIYQSISRQSNTVSRIVRLPENRIADYTKINRIKKAYEESGLTSKEIDEIAMRETGLSSFDYNLIIATATKHASLNSTVSPSEGNEKELIELIEIDSGESVEDYVVSVSVSNELYKTIQTLPEICKDAVISYYKIEALYKEGKVLTPKSVRERYSITHDSYRRHLRDGLKMLRSNLTALNMSSADFLAAFSSNDNMSGIKMVD